MPFDKIILGDQIRKWILCSIKSSNISSLWYLNAPNKKFWRVQILKLWKGRSFACKMPKPCRIHVVFFFISSSRVLGRTFPLKKLRWALDVKGGGPGFGGEKTSKLAHGKRCGKRSSWWHCLHSLKLIKVVVSNIFLFLPVLGDDFQFGYFFLNGLKPPTS